MRNILLVVTEPEKARILFEKAERLAQGSDVRLHVIQVIHEGVADISVKAIDDSSRLKTFILESAETALEDLVEPLRAKFPNLETATLWNARRWEGVLHAAERAEADLIVKMAGADHRFGDAVRPPDDWNLLRHARVPVMLLKADAWPRSPRVLCAVDVFDDEHEALNLALLSRAEEVCDQLGGDLNIVCAFPLFEPWIGELGAAASYTDIRNSVEKEIRERIQALASRAGVKFDLLLLEEGHPALVLSRLTEEAEPALLVLGTHSREGVRGALLGNTSERILHHVDADVVTVPAPA